MYEYVYFLKMNEWTNERTNKQTNGMYLELIKDIMQFSWSEKKLMANGLV